MSQLPPGPPPTPPPTPMFDSPVLQNYPSRPVSVTVLSIIVLVFYGAALLCSPFSLLVFLLPQKALAQQAKNPMLDLMNNNQAYRTYLIIAMVLGLAISVMYVIGAINSLRNKPSGRRMMIWMSIAALVMALLNLGATIFIVTPELMHAYRTATEPPVRISAMISLISGLAGPFLGTILPGCILYFFQTPRVVQFFDQAPTQPWNTI